MKLFHYLNVNRRQDATRAQSNQTSGQDSDDDESSPSEFRSTQSMLFNCGKKSSGKKKRQRKEDQKGKIRL